MAAFEIATSGGEKIKVGVKKYRGHDVLSVRKWYLNAYEGKWFPTMKGITLSANRWREILPELVRLLEPAGEAQVAMVTPPTVLTRNRPKKVGKL